MPEPITGEKYEEPTYTSIPTGWLRAYTCGKCGSVVDERMRPTHTTWHADLARAMVLATNAIAEVGSLAVKAVDYAHSHGPGA